MQHHHDELRNYSGLEGPALMMLHLSGERRDSVATGMQQKKPRQATKDPTRFRVVLGQGAQQTKGFNVWRTGSVCALRVDRTSYVQLHGHHDERILLF